MTGVKRGGGAAIIADTRFCKIQKLDIFPPKSLEVVWALIKPKNPQAIRKKIIVVSEFLNCCDRNNLSIEKLLSIDQSLKRIVKQLVAKYLMSY